MEGTWEEMVADVEIENNEKGNLTDTRFKRQAEIPDTPPLDNSK